MASVPATYECKACKARREVTVVDDSASKPLPEKAEERSAYVNNVLRHATCPVCKARDPEAVAAHRREEWRHRIGFAAFFALIALASVFVPKLALFPAIIGMLIWVIALRIRVRRRYWQPIIIEIVIAGSTIAWVLAKPALAYLVPAAYAILILWPRASSSDPFTDAAEQLRFTESPYRG